MGEYIILFQLGDSPKLFSFLGLAYIGIFVAFVGLADHGTFTMLLWKVLFLMFYNVSLVFI